MIVKHCNDVEKKMADTGGAKGAGLRWVLGPDDNMPNFHLRVVEIEKNGQTPHHSHPFEHLVYLLEGKGELVGEEKTHPLTPGVAGYVAPDEVHHFKNVGDGMMKMICVVPK